MACGQFLQFATSSGLSIPHENLWAEGEWKAAFYKSLQDP